MLLQRLDELRERHLHEPRAGPEVVQSPGLLVVKVHEAVVLGDVYVEFGVTQMILQVVQVPLEGRLDQVGPGYYYGPL